MSRPPIVPSAEYEAERARWAAVQERVADHNFAVDRARQRRAFFAVKVRRRAANKRARVARRVTRGRA